MYVPCIFLYINHYNHNIFFFPHYVVVDYHIIFFVFFINLVCLLQSHKTSKQRSILWSSNNSDTHGNINKPLPKSIPPQFPNAVHFSREIYPKKFITPREWD